MSRRPNTGGDAARRDLRRRFDTARDLERTGDFPAALREYAAIIKQHRDCKDAFQNLGALYTRMSCPNKALSCFKRAVALGEDYLSYFNLGCLYYTKGDFKRAVINLDRSRRLNPDFMLSLELMALSFTRLKNYRAAETSFDEVLRRAPRNQVALTAMAILAFDRRSYDRSLEYLNRIIVIDLGNAKMRAFRARVLARLNRFTESASELKEAKRAGRGFRAFDAFVRSVPVERYTDRFGSLEEKLGAVRVAASDRRDSGSLIALSLCHILSGETDAALDFLVEARRRAAH
ncbi:MAG TPA: tetratricopeptide repeat protein [Spirochaetota bacterium]|nr:tetratricopeptide repeat protein [Spirochaetota bacterium]HNT12254.1 tetratricopeptide repeat protein [Spirochaetota bacterium]